MFVYQAVATINHTLNTCMLVAVGLLVNGPYALITTAVSADLGTSPSLQGNSRALATVTAIIDGKEGARDCRDGGGGEGNSRALTTVTAIIDGKEGARDCRDGGGGNNRALFVAGNWTDRHES